MSRGRGEGKRRGKKSDTSETGKMGDNKGREKRGRDERKEGSMKRKEEEKGKEEGRRVT